MIRMGRGSRTEPGETNDYSGTSIPAPTAHNYGTESQQAASRVVTDSESIARDIKEGRLSGFVGHGTVLTGETTFQAMLRIDGHLTGQVTSEGGTLLMGSTGQVDVNIMVSAAIINGTVNGDINATDKLELGRTARVVGNIQTPRLLIEDGAILEGGCTMLKAKEAAEQRKAGINSQPANNELSSYAANE